MPINYNPRVMLMMNHINKDFNKIVQGLGWEIFLESVHDTHSYIIFSVVRESIVHKVGYLYSQSTDKLIYRSLEKTVEVILISGMSFDLKNSFCSGCGIPVLPEGEFIYVMTDWNMEFLQVDQSDEEKQKAEQEVIRIIEENPLEQIYTQLRSLTSRTVAKQSVEYLAQREGVSLSEEIVDAKAEGVSYLVQNAIDYYDNAATRNMTQRLLNLYYGTLAFMEAEMLICGNQYLKLSEIESVTKFGHGMVTFGNATGLKEFYIGVLDRGLFQAWISHRGIDVSGFPSSRKSAEKSDLKISLDCLFRHIPELQNIMREIDKEYKPYFLFPSYDTTFNFTRGMRDPVYERKYIGSYVTFLNLDGKCDLDWEKQLIESFLAPITIIGECSDRRKGSTGWCTFVKHKKDGHHYESYQTHKGLSVSVVIAPLFGKTDDWDVFVVMILYALSIIVRYMPNLWARISHGDLDRYKAVVYQLSRVAERELAQIFLERLTGKKIVISHPQTLI